MKNQKDTEKTVSGIGQRPRTRVIKCPNKQNEIRVRRLRGIAFAHRDLPTIIAVIVRRTELRNNLVRRDTQFLRKNPQRFGHHKILHKIVFVRIGEIEIRSVDILKLKGEFTDVDGMGGCGRHDSRIFSEEAFGAVVEEAVGRLVDFVEAAGGWGLVKGQGHLG